MKLHKIGERWHMVGTRFFCGCPGQVTETRESATVDWDEKCRNCDKRSRYETRYRPGRRLPPPVPGAYKPRFTFRDFE